MASTLLKQNGVQGDTQSPSKGREDEKGIKGMKKLSEAKSSYLSVWWDGTCPVIWLGKQ